MGYLSLRTVVLCVLIFSSGCGPTYAITLSEALRLAHANDPSYLSALENLAVAHARSDQSTGQLLPQLSGTLSYSRTHRRYESIDSPDSLFPIDTPPDISNYNGSSHQLNLTQPLWRHTNMIGIDQARFVVTQNEYEAWAAEQDMLVRLLQTWFELMLAHDAVVAANQSVVATRSLLDQAEAAARIDLTSPPKLAETRAKYEHAVADLVNAEGSEQISRASLEETVGPVDDFVPPALSERYAVPRVEDGQFEAWLARAEASPLVSSAKQALLAAEKEVSKQRSGHEPSLDLVGSWGRNYQGEGSTPSQSGYNVKQNSIGLQLTVPFYSGGVISAKVQEAIALKNKARQDLFAAERKSQSAATTAWYGARSGAAHYKAAVQAIESAALALQAAQSGTAKGFKFELDIAEAQEQYAQAWYEAQKARYEVLTNWLKLKAVIGQLTHDDVTNLDRFMTERPIAPWMADRQVAVPE